MTWNDLAEAKYVRLTTYKKDGTAVGTPVWVAPDGDRLVIWTSADTWKVKRIRRTPAVTLQESDARGRVAVDQPIAGTARVLDDAGTERVRTVVVGKYGWIGALLIKGHKLFRGADRSVGLEVTPAGTAT
ncbi:PPOX class F420-dependent oxidoreductase [Nocardia jejuensis]|uniref:PPOX class F420-dependent oxidoreductase n=1 Tax=Nocardia jejuensis TaxID=328049 RepID=UPI0008369B7F|nr:PPOX class F420-dependent oxidoreductase [Nocardia jejuensis]